MKPKINWFSWFYPEQYEKSAYTIDFSEYYNEGYRGIIFDIDNTLVRHGYPANTQTIRFFADLKRMGMKVCLISNNQRERVQSFADSVGCVPFVYNAHKPCERSYLEAVKRMKIKPSQTIFVGDQIFTDIWGAKKARIYSILVEPIHPKEEIQIVLKRYLEHIILYFYKKSQ